MPQTELEAGLAEGGGFMAAAVVGHDTLHGQPELVMAAHGSLKEGNRALLFLVAEHLRISHAGVIVDADRDAFPAGTSHMIAPLGGDARADALDAPEFLGVQMQQFARSDTFVAHDRWRRRANPLAAQTPAQSRF